MLNSSSYVVNQKVSVIIPFFQKEKGILTKALDSVFKQNNINNIEIILIDDSSPISAQEECDQLTDQQKSCIKIIKQKNKGPAAARNKGLDSISEDTVYIAFLDSDDEWAPEHLNNAITALQAGYDFYFSDHYQLGQSISAFNRAKRITVTEHPLLFNDSFILHKYVGNMQHQILTGNIIGTSTVVYRLKHNGLLRFREDLVRAGEDYLFWLFLTSQDNTNIAFSSAIEAVYGKGINLYSGTQFGTLEHLELVYYETKFKKTVLSEFTLSDEIKRKIKESLEEYKLKFLRGLIHRLRRGKFVSLYLFFKYLLLTPDFLISMPNNLLKIIKER